jgi:hypothetical protein
VVAPSAMPRSFENYLQLSVEVGSNWACPGYHTEIPPQKGTSGATWLRKNVPILDDSGWKANVGCVVLVLLL